MVVSIKIAAGLFEKSMLMISIFRSFNLVTISLPCFPDRQGEKKRL